MLEFCISAICSIMSCPLALNMSVLAKRVTPIRSEKLTGLIRREALRVLPNDSYLKYPKLYFVVFFVFFFTEE